MHSQDFDLTLDQITKIEGHASLTLKIKKQKVEDIKFSIAEFKRFYTQAIRGKPISAVPQLVARICGTCSNAHILCAIKAIERSQHIVPSEQTNMLRKLLNNGLIIRDHGLHLYMFSLPDIYNKDSLLSFDERNPEQHELLHDAFAVKEAGNQLSIWAGGRSVHAPRPVVGGFLTLPDNDKKEEIMQKLKDARPRVVRLIKIFAKCDFTQEDEFIFTALQGDSYDFLNGRIIGSDRRRVPVRSYGSYLERVIIPYSQAAGYRFQGDVMMVGALSRLNLSKDLLHEKTKEDATSALEKFPSKNIYHNNLAQAIEMLHSIDESLDMLSSLTVQEEKPVTKPPQDGIGVGVIEAPRGTLFYRLIIDEKGLVKHGKIVVPTGQNQIVIEKSLLNFANSHPELLVEDKKEELSHEFEKLIRAYDPCMSCASHFLKVKIVKD